MARVRQFFLISKKKHLIMLGLDCRAFASGDRSDVNQV
jgi:hypothetical protein